MKNYQENMLNNVGVMVAVHCLKHVWLQMETQNNCHLAENGRLTKEFD